MEKLISHVQAVRPLYLNGSTASYIPALSKVDPALFAVAIIDENGTIFTTGDIHHEFTLQSIVKVISFIYVCEKLGLNEVLQYVDMEPTGDPFNSIVRLEISNPGKPFNPLINAGAITISSLLPGATMEDKIELFLDFISRLTSKQVVVNQEVYHSETETANRNRAIAYYLKANGFLEGQVEDTLQVYIQQCSIQMDVESLAKIGLILSNDGVDPISGEVHFSKEIAKVAKALMTTCGMYDASGKFATFVGMPSKSGVSGAILSVGKNANIDGLYGHLGIATYGPSIDHMGNSVVGMEFLKRISHEYGLSIF
nr:glutaminase A [Lysinibacillus timonensis]